MRGGVGSNTLDGGTGTDTADYSWNTSAGQPVYISLLNGYAVDQSNSGTGAAPEFGTGQTFNDRLFGVENAVGAPNAPNTLIGDVNANVLQGGNLADTIEGGEGDDTTTGGAGADSFLFDLTEKGSLYASSTGVDHIADFQLGTDKVVLLTTDLGGSTFGVMNADGKTALVFSDRDANGDLVAQGVAVLDNVTYDEWLAFNAANGGFGLHVIYDL